MPAGLEVVNDSNILVLENNYQQLQLVAKGTSGPGLAVQKTVGGDYFGMNFQSFTPTTTGGVPMIAVYCEDYHVGIARHFHDTATPGTNDYYVEFVTRAPTYDVPLFTWYQFDMVKTVSQTLPNFGLEVFDATGTRTYHSSIIPLRTPSVVPITGVGSWPSGTVNYGGTRKYAICTGKGIGWNDPAEALDWPWARILAGKSSSGAINYSYGLFEDSPLYYQAGNADKGMLMVVDVTEL